MVRISVLLIAFLLIGPASRAGVIVNTSLNLTNLTITPNLGGDSGYVSFVPGVLASVYAQAADNLGGGELDQEPNSNTDGPTSTSAAVTLSTASASADASLITTAN